MLDKNEISSIVEKQRDFFNTSVTYSYEYRVNQLKKLKTAIKLYENRFIEALHTDLSKPELESYITEVGYVLFELSHAIKSLKKWMKPKRVSTPFFLQPATSKLYYEPLGLSLIISPFNYPVELSFSPLIFSIAAGNTSVIKTSELTPNISFLIKQLIEETFEPEYISHVSGAIPETTALLENKFDHIFFTGSTKGGSIVMQAAAKNLTPVTLELGGKSPCVIDEDANIDIAVKRIVYGKFMNAGQTCVAPDYVMVNEKIKEQFLEKIKARIIKLYGKDASLSKDYGRIVNKEHTNRLANLIIKNKVVIGGAFDIENKYISPTIMRDITVDDEIMQDEIFGPILPILAYENLDEAFNLIKKLSNHPLSGYIFSESREVQNKFISELKFGGGCINHCTQHLGNYNLPFGGVGDSGFGSYHGFSGFEAFSHKKGILKSVTWFDLFSILYPPYNKVKLGIVRRFFK